MVLTILALLERRDFHYLRSTLETAFHALPKLNDAEIFPGLVFLAKAETCLCVRGTSEPMHV